MAFPFSTELPLNRIFSCLTLPLITSFLSVNFETIIAQALQRDDDEDELSRRYKQQLATEVDPEIEAAMLEVRVTKAFPRRSNMKYYSIVKEKNSRCEWIERKGISSKKRHKSFSSEKKKEKRKREKRTCDFIFQGN